MKICFPTTRNQGLESAVYSHFGSAPLFVIADLETGSVEDVPNRDAVHQANGCSPLKGLGAVRPDAVIVGGIGMGALSQLIRAGIRVYRANEGTIAQNLEQFRQGTLPEFTPGTSCASHGHGHGHQHEKGEHQCCGHH